MTARYTGNISGHTVVDGKGSWTENGRTRSGKWDANWKDAKMTVSGRSSGSWSNSSGAKGTSTININEDDESAGYISGDEGDWVIENGRRKNNILTWEYRNQGKNGCVNYYVRLEISADRSSLNGEYKAFDICKDINYSGKYINYRR